MLIEFSVVNYRSFRDRQTFSFVANASKELKETNTIQSGLASVPELLPAAVVYGANASGKSNLVRALHFMRLFVLNSSKEKQMGEGLGANPFRFDPDLAAEPSEFEVVAIHQGIRYQYGFALNRQRVVEEWLLVFPEGRPQRWFERSFISASGTYAWYFGPKFKGPKEVWRQATRENALFLSTAIQLNSTGLKPLYLWFQEFLKVCPPDSRISPFLTVRRCKRDGGEEKVLEFLNAADLSLLNLEIKPVEFRNENIPDRFTDEMKQALADGNIEQILFVHGTNDTPISATMKPKEESSGTRRLFELAGPLLDILETGKTFVMDELDQSLHIHIVLFLLDLFQNPVTNRKGAQLLFTTHNTALMDPEVFRRDQIWFLEKDEDFASHLYPLTDFKPRKGELFEKGYLKGRYGALPVVKAFGL